MTIDISAQLRRLVLAGLPVLAACNSNAPSPIETGGAPLSPLNLPARCQPREIVKKAEFRTESVAVGFDAKDGRLADLYEACTGSGDYCVRLCREVLESAEIQIPPGHALGGPLGCELGCDSTGRPVARLNYLTSSLASVGRRPEGFAGAVAALPGTTVGDFFAACAELEGASIAAFRILAAELTHHGAPAELVARARLAARDEARHFRLTARLARRFGGRPVKRPQVARPAPRDLMTVAIENATEGCVGETFSAAIALHQGAHAADAEVRAVMAAIAEDELAHAQLAWDVHAWISERLDADGRAALASLRTEAGRRLLDASQAPVAAALVTDAGLPDATTSLRLATAAQSLWAA